MTEQRDWLLRIQRELEQSAERLDGETLAALGRARRRAVGRQGQPRRSTMRRFSPALGGAVTAATLMIIWLNQSPPAPPLADDLELELVATGIDLEFYRELEFYDWLADDLDADPAAGHESG